MSDVALRPRSVTEILDATVQLFRAQFTTVFTVGALSLLPFLVLQTVISVMTGFGKDPGAAGLQGLGNIGIWFGSAVMTGAVIRVASDAYTGGTPDVVSSLGVGFRRIVSLIGAGILKAFAIFGLVMIGGIIAAIALPKMVSTGQMSGGVIGLAVIVVFGGLALALYMGARLLVTEAAIVLEGLHAMPAITRSGKLTRGRIGPLIGLIVLAFIVYSVMLAGVTTLAAMTGSPAIALIITDVCMMLAYPAYAILTMFVYYDCRARNEALDLELMTQSLGVAAPAGVSPLNDATRTQRTL